MSKKRVAITGIGVVSPYGDGVDVMWDAVTKGKSAISNITKFDASNYSVKIAGEVTHFDPSKYMDPKESRKMDPFVQYGVAACDMAIKDSKLELSAEEKDRCGVYAASGIGGLVTLQENNRKLIEKGPRRISPLFIPMVLSNMLPGHISMRYGYRGPNISIVSACASGAHCIGHASLAIQEGKADYMIAGASEAAACELGIGGFASMRALSSRNDDPTHASRPWEKTRDGFVLSEGAAFVVLEDLEIAKKRGAKIYAEVVGYGMSADAYHITQPSEDGSGAALCLKKAIDSAGLKPSDIDYINAHGTATPLGDIAEINAIKKIFGDHVKDLNISSTKSSTGHFLGAAGSLEVILSALSLQNNLIPPTMNLDEVDEKCTGVNLTPHKAVKKDLKHVLSNSFGFGGTNCSVVLKKI